jgi:hypothetical protein
MSVPSSRTIQFAIWSVLFSVIQVMAVDVRAQATPVACDQPVQDTYCYTNNDLTDFLYTAADGSTSLNIEFSAGEIELINDWVAIIDGDQIGEPLLYLGSGDATGISENSTGPDLLMRVGSDDVDSCSDGAVSPPLEWTVSCVLPDEIFDDRFELQLIIMETDNPGN